MATERPKVPKTPQVHITILIPSAKNALQTYSANVPLTQAKMNLLGRVVGEEGWSRSGPRRAVMWDQVTTAVEKELAK